MSLSDTTSSSNLIRLSPELEHFDPYEGLVDLNDNQHRNTRYGFRIFNLNLIFNRSLICEVVRNKNIYSMPNTPLWMNGFINLRGNLVPVIDLYDLWPDSQKPDNLPLMIFGSGEEAFCLYTDAYPQALDSEDANKLPESDLSSVPEQLSMHISESYDFNGTVWHYTDIIGFMEYISRDFSEAETQ